MSMTCHGYSSPNVVVLPNSGPRNPQAGSNCTSGDANWVIRCPPDSAAKTGDFCCSVDGTTSTCCNTPSNGLGLVAAEYSAEAVSISNRANIFPAYISSGATTPSSKSIASPTMSTSPPRHSHTTIDDLRDPFVIRVVLLAVGFMAFVSIVWALWVFPKWINRRCPSCRTGCNICVIIKAMIIHELDRGHERRENRRLARHHRNRQAEADSYIEMDNFRDRRNESDGPEPSSGGAAPNEVEGSQAGPLEMDAGQIPSAAAGPSSSAGPSSAGLSVARSSSAGPSTSRARDGNPLTGPRARARSFVSVNLERR